MTKMQGELDSKWWWVLLLHASGSWTWSPGSKSWAGLFKVKSHGQWSNWIHPSFNSALAVETWSLKQNLPKHCQECDQYPNTFHWIWKELLWTEEAPCWDDKLTLKSWPEPWPRLQWLTFLWYQLSFPLSRERNRAERTFRLIFTSSAPEQFLGYCEQPTP